MRIFVFFIILSVVALVAIIDSGISDALLAFLLSGAVPGTTLTVSPTVMMIGCIAAAWLVLFRLTALSAINVVTMRRLVNHHSKRQARMPKRRYSRI
ncbi:hypothetical protein A2707_02490 [Candidatus Saccharibacteria bacterium RIFCSPHIGHO2_01_FULL_45_15]|nr:MAG: hypothetical protein A2707_02490 [Candidatus Saccharibacteria bacterium RIFCSPHIGHO2_01_FULL_45_15]OGL28764.1 MAG: hypothetical protein A3C39_00325 [Candidatus Saccharibacteria bacterium RIFCSPHIGHO2_02_FULL_46_12]OGL31798.1 MAG: hypothetical protein A3E76_03085 [Candidatus Saccharibacteria bacterium RIFCSPHIGHO2_12_FULL_44_22]